MDINRILASEPIDRLAGIVTSGGSFAAVIDDAPSTPTRIPPPATRAHIKRVARWLARRMELPLDDCIIIVQESIEKEKK